MAKYVYCPHCGCQYLPGEIFEPKYFLGQPKYVARGNNGEIIGYEGIEADTTESFVCGMCGKTFEVSASISFSTRVDNGDFKESTPKYTSVELF